MNSDTANLEASLLRLHSAVHAERSVAYCWRLWSKFVRLRDGYGCVVCGEEKGRMFAHHICRKSFLRRAQFDTGNGITLCQKCHAEVHEGFNGRPDLQQPMDAQGAEKLETLTRLYGTLLDDARQRGLLRDDFYYLSDEVLTSFKLAQGFEVYDEFRGFRLEQAYEIWNQCPQHTLRAVLMAVLLD